MTTARAQSGIKETSVKALGVIYCLSALALIVGLTGCASDRYTQVTGHRIKDQGNQTTDQSIEGKRMAERVREAFAAAPDYEFGQVQVAAGKGVVQLSGVVNTSAQRNLAGEVASKVAGVKIVLNSLTVMN